MIKNVRLTLAIVALSLLAIECSALRGLGRNTSKNDGYKDPGKAKTLAGTSAGIPAQKATRRGLGISAWGIVTVIVSLILAGMGFYYFSMCYPILCKKTRKYDMIEKGSLGSHV